MAAFPLASDIYEAYGVLALWALGSTVLGSSPAAHVANTATPDMRTQSLALNRTMGDVGLFVGASTVGGAALLVGNDVAMQSTAAILAVTAVAYALKK